VAKTNRVANTTRLYDRLGSEQLMKTEYFEAFPRSDFAGVGSGAVGDWREPLNAQSGEEVEVASHHALILYKTFATDQPFVSSFQALRERCESYPF
jgi:hypothetical protein